MLHYNIHPLFKDSPELMWKVYDCIQSLIFLMLYYAFYLKIHETFKVMKFLIHGWLWYAVGDLIQEIQGDNYLDYLDLEHVSLVLTLISIPIFVYKNKINENTENKGGYTLSFQEIKRRFF